MQFASIPCEGYLTTADSLLEEYVPVKQPVQSITANVISGAWALTLARHNSTTDILFSEVVSGHSVDFPADNVVGASWRSFRSEWPCNHHGRVLTF